MKKSLLAITIAFSSLQMTTVIAKSKTAPIKNEQMIVCAGCHGKKGNSTMPLFPKLANQNEEYLIKQLLAFKNGTRIDASMNGIVADLTDKHIKDIAIFYEQQKITANALPPLEIDDEDDDGNDLSPDQLEWVKEAAIKRQGQQITLGRDIYRNGELEREISACIACHGPEGEGNKPASFPAVKGQHADYLIKSLMDFKSGIRSNTGGNMMHLIAKKMTDKEITATAYYMSVMK